MKKSLTVALMLLLSASWLTSCAYMQLHKQIESEARVHRGFYIERPTAVYSHRGQWYLKAQGVQLKKEYPLIHDTILLTQNNKPRPIIFNKESEIYISISSGTAKVLQRTDGYASLSTLRDEMSNGQILSAGVGQMKSYPVRAEVEAKKADRQYHIYDQGEGEPLSFGTRALSTASLVLVDAPGTVIYNVAIPFMAPFVFFYDFLSEDEVLEHVSYLYRGEYDFINKKW